MAWENQITAELWNGYREYREHEFVLEKNGKADEIMTFIIYSSSIFTCILKEIREGNYDAYKALSKPHICNRGFSIQ